MASARACSAASTSSAASGFAETGEGATTNHPAKTNNAARAIRCMFEILRGGIIFATFLGIGAGRFGHLQHALRGNAEQWALCQKNEIGKTTRLDKQPQTLRNVFQKRFD